MNIGNNTYTYYFLIISMILDFIFVIEYIVKKNSGARNGWIVAFCVTLVLFEWIFHNGEPFWKWLFK